MNSITDSNGEAQGVLWEQEPYPIYTLTEQYGTNTPEARARAQELIDRANELRKGYANVHHGN